MIQSNQEKEIDNTCNIIEVGFSYESNNKSLFSRNNFISFSDINQFVASRNMRGTYRSAFRYSSTDIDNALMYGDLYFDLDDVNNFETVRKDAITVLNTIEVTFLIDKKLVQIYYSGYKGIHLILSAKTLGIQPCDNLNEIYKYIALNASKFTPFKTIDTQIYDNRRLFRIPNTINEKSGLYKIPLTYEELETLPIEKIKEMATTPRVMKKPEYYCIPTAYNMFQKYIQEYERYVKTEERGSKKKHKKTFDFIPPCVQHILDNGAVEGTRNMSIACLAGFYSSYGCTLNETLDNIKTWNSKNSKPTGERELTATVKSIFNGEKQYGCKTFSQISMCSKECKVYQNKNKDEDIDPENTLVCRKNARRQYGRQNISNTR